MNKWLRSFALLAVLSFSSVSASDEFEKNDVLISAEEAIKLIGKPNVMFVTGDSDDIYKLGHIKGSVEMYAHHLHHSDIMGNMHCEPLFRCIDDAEKYIGSKGIDNNTMVIAYDDFKGPNATGVYAFFKSYGHENVKVLNGGRNAIMELDPAQKSYDAIRDEQKELKKAQKKAKNKLKDAKKGKITLTVDETKELNAYLADTKAKMKDINKRLKAAEQALLVVKGEEEVVAKTYHIDPNHIDVSHIAGKDEVAHASADIVEKGKDSKFVIIDTRGMAEIIGDRKMDNVARGGHVPGATFLEWKNVSDMDKKMSFKSPSELKAMFERYSVTKDKTIYAYCQVGTGRGSEIITALEMLGYPNAKVYSGSWDQWGNDMNLPIKR